MDELRVGLTIGQIAGTVGAVWLFVRGFKAEFEKFRQEHYAQIERIQERLTEEIQKLQDSHAAKIEKIQREHYRLREEIAREYLRREEWLINHNKLEAKIEKHFEKIEELLRKKG